MRKTLILGATLLLSTTALGVTLAAASNARSGEHSDVAADRTDPRERIVLASNDRDHGQGSRHRRYAEHDDEEDDDDEDGAGSGRPAAAPDPNAPVPDNGLFNGKARPKVDVQ
jgi:hypothetical protein